MSIDTMNESALMSDDISERQMMIQEMQAQYSDQFNSMSLDDKLRTLEMKREELEEKSEVAAAILRLKDNDDFEMVFTKLFFKDEAARLVLLKANYHTTNPQSESQLAASERMLTAIGETFKWLTLGVAIGTKSDMELDQLDETRQAIIDTDVMLKENDRAMQDGDESQGDSVDGSDLDS